MNIRRVINVFGYLFWTEAALMLIPLLISLFNQEGTYLSFLIPILSLGVCGLGCYFVPSPRKEIRGKEGFFIVGLSWILLSLFGCLPFIISQQIPSFIDAFFEIVSGFTTTGASILSDVSVLSASMLFWRSFSHWIGGMGVLVFILTFMPSDEGSIFYIMKAESPGPKVGKLVSKLKSTAQLLYIIYAFLTILEMVFLIAGGMDFFDSVCNSLATAGTGGFVMRPYDISGTEVVFGSTYCQMVIAIFMVIFGMNFNFFYMILIGKFVDVLKSEERRTYIGIVFVAVISISLNLYLNNYHTLGYGAALRDAFFQVASIQTTTGFATADFNTWPMLSKTILVLLMFIGGCAGSTAGGLKVSRVCILFKSIRRETKRMIHPRQVSKVYFEGQPLDEATVSGVVNYTGLFFILYAVFFLILSFDKYDFEINFTAVAACINNIGPGLGAVGPLGNYGGFSVVSKITLIFAMLIGRLELYPLLMVFMPDTYSKK